jgi:hypothetical protein
MRILIVILGKVISIFSTFTNDSASHYKGGAKVKAKVKAKVE